MKLFDKRLLILLMSYSLIGSSFLRSMKKDDDSKKDYSKKIRTIYYTFGDDDKKDSSLDVSGGAQREKDLNDHNNQVAQVTDPRKPNYTPGYQKRELSKEEIEALLPHVPKKFGRMPLKMIGKLVQKVIDVIRQKKKKKKGLSQIELDLIREIEEKLGQEKKESGAKKSKKDNKKEEVVDSTNDKKRKERDEGLDKKLPEVKLSELNPVDEKAKTHNLNENLQKFSQEREQNQKQGSFEQSSNVSQSFNINDFMEKNGLNEPGVKDVFLNELDKHIKKNPDLKKKIQDYIRKRSKINSDDPMPAKMKQHLKEARKRLPPRDPDLLLGIQKMFHSVQAGIGNVSSFFSLLKTNTIDVSVDEKSNQSISYGLSDRDVQSVLHAIDRYAAIEGSKGVNMFFTAISGDSYGAMHARLQRAIKVINTYLSFLSLPQPFQKYVKKDSQASCHDNENFLEKFLIQSAKQALKFEKNRKDLVKRVATNLTSSGRELFREVLDEYKEEGYHWRCWYAIRKTLENLEKDKKIDRKTTFAPILDFLKAETSSLKEEASLLQASQVRRRLSINQNRHTENITPLIRHHLDIAQFYTTKNDFEKAFSSLQFARELLTLERRIDAFICKRDIGFSNGITHGLGNLFNWVTRQKTKVNYYKEFGKRLSQFVKDASWNDIWHIKNKLYDAANALSKVIENNYKDKTSFKKAMLSDGQKHLDATKKRSYKDYQELIHFVESKLEEIKRNVHINSIVFDEDDIWIQGDDEILHPVEFIYRQGLKEAVERASKIDLETKEKKKEKGPKASKKKTTEEKKPQSKKRDEKQKSSNQTSTRIAHLSTLSQASDIERYGQDHILMCGYYAAHSARILAANHNQSPQTLRGLLNDRRSYEQQTLNPGRNLVRQMRNNRNGISYLEGSEIEDILAGGRNRGLTGNIIVYGTDRGDSDMRALALIQQFQGRQIDHLVYVTTTTNSDSHWITVLVRRDQNNQVELVVTDSLGRDRSNEENVQAIYNQFVGSNNQKAQKKSSSNLSSKNKEKKNKQSSSSSFSQAGVSPSCDNKQNIEEEFIIPEDDVEEYQEPKTKDTKKRKRSLKDFTKDKKKKPNENASRPRRKAFVKAKDSLKKMSSSGRRKRRNNNNQKKKSKSNNDSDEPGGGDSSQSKSNKLAEQVNNPSIIQDESIHQTLPLLYDHNPYKDIFNSSKSSVLDKKFHEKLVSINSQTSQLLENSKHDVLLQSNADIIYCFTSLAKLQQDPKVAEHLVDFCDYFIQAAQAEDAAFTKVAKTMARGTILGVRDNLRYTAQVWKKRLTDPVGSFKDELDAYKKAGQALCRALKLAVTNPKVLGEKAYEKFENIVSGAQGDPEQFFASVVSFLLPTDPVGNRLKKQFKSGLKSAFKKQANLAAKVVGKKTKKAAQRAVEPAKKIFNDVNKKSNLVNQSLSELLKSKSSYEKLIKEHKEKLRLYIKNPDRYDNKGLLRDVSQKVRQKIIQGRALALQKQINKQQGELEKIKKILEEVGKI